MNEITIVAIGDSIIRGTADDEKGGWVNRLTEKMKNKYKINLIKKGAGGDTSKGVLKRLHEDCIKFDPDLVILGFGVNDSRRRESLGNSTEIPLENFKKFTEKLIEIIREETKSKIIISGMVPVDDRGADYKEDKAHFRKDQKTFEVALREIANKYNVSFINHFDVWLENGETWITSMLVDGLHPSSKGHSYMAKESFNLVDSLICKINGSK